MPFVFPPFLSCILASTSASLASRFSLRRSSVFPIQIPLQILHQTCLSLATVSGKALRSAGMAHAKPDHGHITFTDGTSEKLDSAVNVESSSADTRLVYWLLRDFDKTHPIAQKLTTLEPGFHAQKGEGSLGLDFLRDSFLDVNDGLLLSHDAPGSGHDILDYLDPILNQAVTSKATIYLYGSKYDGGNGDGIHDIHMNQEIPAASPGTTAHSRTEESS